MHCVNKYKPGIQFGILGTVPLNRGLIVLLLKIYSLFDLEEEFFCLREVAVIYRKVPSPFFNSCIIRV